MAYKETENVGKRLVAGYIDEMAASHPEKVVFIVGKGHELADGLLGLTFKDLAHIVNFTAWWIEKKWGCSPSHETLLYIGASDIRYLAFIVACHKTGHKVRGSRSLYLLLNSSKNEGACTESQCTFLIAASFFDTEL